MYLGFWKRVLINGIFFIAIAGLYSSGLHVANVWVAFMAAFVLGLLNTFVKQFLIILSLLFIVIFITCIGLTMAAKSSEEISKKFAERSLKVEEEEK